MADEGPFIDAVEPNEEEFLPNEDDDNDFIFDVDDDDEPMPPIVPPTLDDPHTKASFDLFKELNYVKNGNNSAAGSREIQLVDVGRLDEEKMKTHILDCVAALAEKQRVRVALEEPLTLQEGGDALTREQQIAQNAVFVQALNLLAMGLTHDGGGTHPFHPAGSPSDNLSRAFPDSRKLTDGRGWLPMQWSVVPTDLDWVVKSDLSASEVKSMHETYPAALRDHHPELLTQRDQDGCTVLLQPVTYNRYNTCGTKARLLLETGGREAASTAILHPRNAQHPLNGWLPLHMLIDGGASTLTTQRRTSGMADVFRLMLCLYPEAAGIEGGNGVWKKTPYQLAVEKGLPAYYRRLLLRAAPDLDPAELRRLNSRSRRLPLCMAFIAEETDANGQVRQPLMYRLRVANKDLMRHVLSFF
jgi:hypothetical protein